MSSSRIVADPDKWVTVGKSKTAVKPAQRPLVSRHIGAHIGIKSPPSTGGKRRGTPSTSTSTATSKPRVTQTTPSTAQRPSIKGFFDRRTTSTPTPRPHATHTPKTGPSSLTRSTLKQLDVNTRRSRSRSPTKPYKSNRLDSVEGVSVAAWKATLDDHKPLKPSHLRPGSPSEEDAPMLDEPAAIPTTPEAPSLSLRVLTPVPPEVLARHARLCGQDSATRKRVKSPWRMGEDDEDEDDVYNEDARAKREAALEAKVASERERKRVRLREAVGKDTTERIRKSKDRRVLGEFKSLVHASSSPSRSSPSHRFPSADKHSSNSLRRHSSAIEGPVCTRDESWPQRQHRQPFPTTFSRQAREYSDTDTPKPNPPTRQPAKLSYSSRDEVVSPETTSQHSTPRKRRTPHHRVTPPKTRSPQYVDEQKTLFEWSAPPKQPVFEPLFTRRQREWKPVSMDPETLMTWSLGEEDDEEPGKDKEPAVNEEPAMGDEPPMDVSPDSEMDDDNASVAASVPSQQFPCLVVYSPKSSKVSPSRDTPLRRPSQKRTPANEPSSESDSLIEFLGERKVTSVPRSRPIAPQKKPQTRFAGTARSKDDPKKPSPKPKPGDMPPPSQRHSARPKTKDSSQSKLAAFGFFHQQSPRHAAYFDKSFSDEEDLDFGIDDEPQDISPSHGLQPVPEAPPHPSFRPAGLRALAKRNQDETERHRAQQVGNINRFSSRSPIPPPSSFDYTDTSSSLPEDAPRFTESVTAFWEMLPNRTIDDSL